MAGVHLEGLRVSQLETAEVGAETEQAEVPTDADRSPEPISHLRRDGGVLHSKDGLRVAHRIEHHLDDRGVLRTRLAHDPGHEQATRRLAFPDLASGVALELVGTTEPEVALDREEPSRDPLGIGKGIPDVVDGRGIGPRCRYDMGISRGELPSRTARLMLSIASISFISPSS